MSPASTTATPAPAAATPPAGGATPPAAAAGGAATPPASIAAESPKAAEVSADDAKKYLIDKGGNADELGKLDEAGLRAKYDEAKAAETKAAEKTGAEAIEIKVPEGFTIDEKTMAAFKEALADDKLTPSERGQKLADMHVAALKAASEAPYALWKETQTKWQTEVKADAEIGGANFDTMKSTVAKAIDDIGGEQAAKMREALDFTGAGNHPEIIRLFYRLAKAATEGGPVSGGALASQGDANKKALTALYPSAAAPT